QLGELISLENVTDVLEVSYSKYPEAVSGQMADGLKQVCIEISRMNALIDDNKSDSPSIAVTAYVIPGNEASVRVLQKAGFEEVGGIQYDADAEDKDRAFLLN